MRAKLFVVVACAVVGSGCASSEDVGNDSNPATVGGTAGAGATSNVGGASSGGASASGGKGGTASGGQAGSGGSAGEPGSGGAPSGPPADVSGQVVSLLDWQVGVAGVTVCVYDDPSVECVTSDSDGRYALKGVPGSSDVLIKYTKTGYFPALVTVRTTSGAMDVGKFPAPTNTEATGFAAAVGVTIDFTKGHILTLALTGGSTGSTGQDAVWATLTPSSGLGPFYANASYLPDKSLKWTSTAGAGLFANVDEGDAEVEMEHFSKTCARYPTSWPGATTTSSKVRVVAGYVTGGAILVCP